jgi:hypothetical protein
MQNFSKEFQHLADQFQEIPVGATGDRGRYLRTIKTSAAKAVKRCQEAGQLEIGEIEWPAAGSKSIDPLRELAWCSLWDAFCIGLQRQYPDDLPENVLLMEHLVEPTGNDAVYHVCGENWQLSRGYAAVCRLLARLVDEQTSAPSAADIGNEERALALLVKHPGWSQVEMAEAVGVSRTTLYRFKKYQAAREVLQTGRAEIPCGSKDADGNLEAWERDTLRSASPRFYFCWIS